MVMKRFQMNHQKQVWKEFGEWLVQYYKLENKQIEYCQIIMDYYFPDYRKRDPDNYSPKNLFDAFTVSGLLIDDDFNHVESLLIRGQVDKGNPEDRNYIYPFRKKKTNGNPKS